jgi:hypothetical protein
MTKEEHKKDMLMRRIRQDMRNGTPTQKAAKYDGTHLREIRATKGVGRPV